MPYSGKRKHPYKLTIYIPPEKEPLVKQFIKAFRARNESASQKILDMIEETMMNGKINPQTRLLNNSRPTPICSFKGCYREAVWNANYKDNLHKVCNNHYTRFRKSNSWIGWRKL